MQPVLSDLPTGTHIRTVSKVSTVNLNCTKYKVDAQRAYEQVLVVSTGPHTGDAIIITDPHGEVLIEHTRPAPGTPYVGNGQPRGARPKNPKPSPKS